MPLDVVVHPQCAACAEQCKPDCSNWPTEEEKSDRGEPVPDGPLCSSCQHLRKAHNLDEDHYIKAMNGEKGLKKEGVALKKALDEHHESVADMDSRPFQIFDVHRVTCGGVFVEDRNTGWQSSASVKNEIGHDAERLQLAVQKKDLPGRHNEEGILRDLSGSSSSGSGGIVSVGMGSVEPIVRWTGTRIELREVLLDGRQDFL